MVVNASALDLQSQTKTWQCAICGVRNGFPMSYNGITPSKLPGELHPTSTTIEYVIPGETTYAPVFMFIVNIGTSQSTLEDLKPTLLDVMEDLPDNCYVGLITIGSTVICL